MTLQSGQEFVSSSVLANGEALAQSLHLAFIASPCI